MGDFYIVLLSNTPLETDGHIPIRDDPPIINKISEFVTQLPHPIYLSGEYECALCDFSYYHSWNNIQNGEAYIKISYTSDTPLAEIDRIDLYNDHVEYEFDKNICKLTLKDGYYNSGTQLMETLNNALEQTSYETKFCFNEITNKLDIKLRSGEKIELSEYLAALLGFKSKRFRFMPQIFSDNVTTFVSDNAIDFNLKTHNMFVYCDILEKTLLGKYYYPLLSIIPTRENDTQTYVNKSFTNRHYIPLNSKTIARIKISIKDDQDELIKFNAGRTLLKLHFRPKIVA